MIVRTDTIKDWKGIILGYIETDEKGNKTVKDWKRIIRGFYKKQLDITTDFRGRIITKGDTAISLLYMPDAAK